MKKGKFEKKISRRILSGLLALLMVVSGICTTWKLDEAQASGTTEAHFKAYSDISNYRGSNPTAPKPTDEDYKNWIFAGWYEEDLTTAMTSAEADAAATNKTTVYAKFVPAEILSVKGQVSADPSTATSVKLRLVTTIDNDQYNNVGFNISIPALNGYSADYPMDKAYEKIVAAEDSVKFEYEPSVFHTMSTAFATAIITNISKTNFDMGICVTPYWTTMDGTRVDGVGRYLRANDVLGTTVNVPVRLYSDTAVTNGSLTVNYDADTFTYLGMDNGNTFTEVSVDTTTTAGKAVCSVADQTATADGMLANLRFELKDGVTLLNRDAFEDFSVTGETTWNASYKVYTSMEALSDVIPDKLLSNTEYEVLERIGLDSTDSITMTDSNSLGATYQISETGSVFDNALNATTTNPNNNPQVRVDLDEDAQFSLKGVSGVLWHVDFSKATLSETKTFFRTSIPLIVDGHQYRARKDYTNGKSIGYFFDEASEKWTQVADGGAGCQLPLPVGSKGGWMYVPLNAYGANSYEILYDDATGLGKDLTLTGIFWIAQNYSNSTTNTIVLDEVLFVRGNVLNDVIPTTLPENELYDIQGRVSLDAGSASATGTKYWGSFASEAGVCGGALSFASGVYAGTTGATTAKDPSTATGTLTNGECSITPTETIDISGANGIMWYVDFSQVTYDDRVRTEIVIAGKDADGKSYSVRATQGTVSPGTTTATGLGYYYQDGAWTSTYSYGGGRMVVPEGFTGWIYVPLSSYATNTAMENGVAVEGATVTSMSLYQLGFEYETDKYITYDEIMFVKGYTLEDVIPETLPENASYDIQGRVSLDEGSVTAKSTKYWGNFTDTAGVYGGALSFASGVYAGESGATTAKDPSTTTGTITNGECTVTPIEAVDISGANGIMWYVDFSEITYDDRVRSEIVIAGKDADGKSYSVRATQGTVTPGTTTATGLGYYYLDGVWTTTYSYGGGRMVVPEGFAGWIYVPLSSYATNTAMDNGVAVEGATVTSMSLYQLGFEYETDKYITYDEILFVKKK